MQMMLTRFPSFLVTGSRHLLIVPKLVIPTKWITYSPIMCDAEDNPNKIDDMKHDLFGMYKHAISSVKPSKLVSRVLHKCDANNYLINGQKYSLNKNLYVVGFGKAILDMALKVNEVLGDHIVRGILSVPVGIQQSPEVEELKKRNIQIREGAEQNLPDQNAECTAREIANLADSLGEGTILLVLISGGGSALLPAPVSGITVEETAQLVSELQSKGASIHEINSVRKRLCSLKGGKLAVRACPARVISLILSDVIGDPLDFIASGPTVENQDPPILPLEIIKKYELQNKIHDNILQELMRKHCAIAFPRQNVFNVLIGSNSTALQATQYAATKLNYYPIILSDKVACSVEELSEWYSSLCVALWKAHETRKCNNLQILLDQGVERFDFSSDVVEMFLDFLPRFHENAVKGLCLIAGGEPTVQVKRRCGSKGGRSQELALQFSVKIHALSHEERCDDMVCILMAAGTDGIDGPTDIAGAYGYSEQIDYAINKGLRPQTYIDRSNSYGYFNSLAKDFIKIGHTGTNVMDLHVILIRKK